MALALMLVLVQPIIQLPIETWIGILNCLRGMSCLSFSTASAGGGIWSSTTCTPASPQGKHTTGVGVLNTRLVGVCEPDTRDTAIA